jgi:hypothetical protein
LTDYDGGKPVGIYMLPLGTVRLLITDTATDTDGQIFSDDQIEAFLSLSGGNVYRAAADALLVMAANETLLSKKIRTQDLSTDGPAVSAELRALAKVYTERAAADEPADESFFDVVPFGYQGKNEGEEWRL